MQWQSEAQQAMLHGASVRNYGVWNETLKVKAELPHVFL